MIIILTSILLILNLWSKKNRVLFIATVIFMWLIMTFVYNIADITIYINRYENPTSWAGKSELLFSLIIDFCRGIGMPFLAYKGVICAIEIMLISTAVWKMSQFPNVVIMLYFLCPFPLNVAQLRFGLATSIFIFASQYLFIDKSKRVGNQKINITWNDVKYVTLILIASLIHSASAIWMIFIIAKKCSIKTTILVTFISNVVIYYVFNPNSIGWLLNQLGASIRMNAYMSQEYQFSNYRHFGAIIHVLFCAIILFIFVYITKKDNLYVQKDAILGDSISIVLKMNIVVLVVLSMILRFTGEMYRPQEPLIILNYIFMCNSIPSSIFLKSKKKTIYFVSELLIVLLAIGLLWFKILHYNTDALLVPILRNNYFFGLGS